MGEMYDYNFVSSINRAYSKYPEKLNEIIKDTFLTGTKFQKAFICGLIDYMRNRNLCSYAYLENTKLSELTVPDIVKDGYSKEAPIPEFMEHNIYVTKVGWT